MTDLDGLRRDYRVAFLRYLPRREEAPLLAGYEIGRTAVGEGVSLLDVVRIHHEVLLDVLVDVPREEVAEVAASASDFLLEVLSTFDMAQRRLHDESPPHTDAG